MTLTEFNRTIADFGRLNNTAHRFTMTMEDGVEVAFAYTMLTADFNMLEGIKRHQLADFILVSGEVVKDRYTVFVPEYVRNMMNRLKERQ